ncbi:MAG: ferritin-like domain-containing protein, partial [Sulfuriferula sp.]
MQNELSNILIDPTRRGFIRQASVMSLGALAAVSLAQANPAAAETMKSGMSKSDHGDVAVLNTALALEYQAIAAYQVGAESNLLQKPVLAVAVKFQSHHRAHADILSATVKKLGGTPVETL